MLPKGTMSCFFCLLFAFLYCQFGNSFPFLPTSSPLLHALFPLPIAPSVPNPNPPPPPPLPLSSRLGSHIIGSPEPAATLVISQANATEYLRRAAVFAHLHDQLLNRLQTPVNPETAAGSKASTHQTGPAAPETSPQCRNAFFDVPRRF